MTTAVWYDPTTMLKGTKHKTRFACLPLDAESWAALPRLIRQRIGRVLSYPVDEHVWQATGWMTLALQERIIGMHLYRMAGVTLDSIVTWVAPAARKSGVGQRLWLQSLSLQESRHVEVTTCSRSGLQLVKSLQRQKPLVQFRVFENS